MTFISLESFICKSLTHENKHSSESLMSSQRKSGSPEKHGSQLVIGNVIYCKLLDIMIDLRNLELHNFLNLQIGALHASGT